MAAILGTVPFGILIRIGNNEPCVIGEGTLDIETTALPAEGGGVLGVHVHAATAVAHALREAADEVERHAARTFTEG
jgi:hypothetical protein